ncbi:MAG TPA: nuclear transport factor 2 family protein [Roseiflexaceae bacterium]|nr:nuclear transport factor 2 family protein [Roseiflexaceae bacterium]
MTAQNVQVVHDLYDAFRRADVPSIMALFAPDVTVIEPNGLPYEGEYHGHDGLMQVLQGMGAAWERIDALIEQTVAQGDDVVVLATLVGKLRGIEQEIRMPLAEHWRVRDGRIVFGRVFYGDTGLIARLWAERA